MNLNISLEEYKKIKIREVVRTFINQPRFEEMKRELTSSQKIKKWKKYKDFQEKLDLEQKFIDIENIENVDQNDSMLIELEILMKNKSCEVQNLFNPLPYEHLIHIIYQKKGIVGLQDLKHLTYTSNKTYRIIYEKIIQDPSFMDWRQKYFKTQETAINIDTRMDVQQPVVSEIRIKQEDQIQTKNKRPTINNFMSSQSQSQSQYTAESVDNDRIKISSWLSKINPHYINNSQDIPQLKLLQHMLNLLQSKQKIKLKYIENLIKNEERWNDDLEDLFTQWTHGDQTINIVLSSVLGFMQLKKIYEMMVGINIFQLEERCQLSKFDDVLECGVFMVGNTGVGKTTLIQNLLGYKLIKEKDSYQNITLSIDRQAHMQIRKEHQRLVAGSSSESITTFLTSVSLHFQNKVIHLIDSPGFEDTRGALTDIANQIMLQKAYEMCRNTAYVILTDITKLQIDKSQGIKTLVLNIAKRFEYSSLDELKGFVLLIFNNKFNRASEKDIHNLRVTSKFFQNNEQIISNPKNKIALQLLIHSLRSNDHFFDPLKTESAPRMKQMIASLNFNRNNKMQTSFQNNTKQSLRETARSIKKIMQRSNERCSLRKKQFYYSLFYKLYVLIPCEIRKGKDEIDCILETQSTKIYQSICEYLDDRLKLKRCDQNQFNTFKANIQRLRQYKNLSLINTNIKSNNQIFEKIQSFQQQYLRKIDHTLTEEQAKNQHNFLTNLQQQFGQTQSIITKIKRSFTHRMNQMFQTIGNCFQRADHQSYDESTHLVQKLLKISAVFEFDLTQQSLQIAQLLSDHQMTVQQIYNNLIRASQKCTQWFDTQDNQIMQLQRSYQEFSKYADFKMLNKNQTKEAIQNQLLIKIEVSLSTIFNQLELFLRFPPQFHLQINKHATRIKQLLKLLKLEIESIKPLAIDHYRAIEVCLNKKITQFAQQLQEILNSLRNSEVIKKHDKYYYMTNRIQAFQKLSQHFSQKDKLNKIKQLHSKYCSELEMKYEKIVQASSQKITCYKESQITTIVHDLNAFQSYANLDSKNSKTYLQLKETYEQWIKNNFDQIYNVFSIKFSNLEQLKNKFNKKFIKLLRQRIINILIPIQPYLGKEGLIQCLYEVYCSIRNVFQSLQKLVKDQYLNSKEHDNNNNADHQKRMSNFVETLCYVYEILKKQISGDNVITLFLANPSPFISTSTTVSTSQLQKYIEEAYILKIKEIKEKLYSISDLTSNLSTLNSLKNQCHVWKKMEELIKRQNKELYLQNRENLNELLQLFTVKMAKIEKRQLNKLQTVIDREHCSIRNIPQIAKIYKDLKESFLKKIFTSSQQNFQTFLQTLSICIHSKRRAIKNQFNHLQGDDISSAFLYNLEEFIELYQVLVSCINQDDIKKFSITFVEEMRKEISMTVEKIDFLWSSSVSTIQRMIIERQFIKVNKMLNSLKYQRDLIESFQKTEIQRTKSTGQQMTILINTQKYQQDITILQQKRTYEQKNRDNFIANPFENEEHTNRIISLYNTENQMARMKLRRKIREDFTRKLQAYKNIESDQGHSMYYQLYVLLDKIPSDILRDNNWTNQVQKIRKDKQEQEKIQLKEISNFKLDNPTAKSQLFMALNQNKSARLINQIVKKIKQMLSQTKASIRQSKSVHSKINAFQQIITLFNKSCSGNLVNKDVLEMIKVFQRDVFVYFKDLIQNLFKVISSNLTKKSSSNKQSECKQYVKVGIELYYFLKTWNQQKSTEQLKIVLHFREFIQNLVNQFRTVCPLRKTLKELDSSIFPIHSIQELLNRIQIYKQITHSIQEFQHRSNQANLKLANKSEAMQENQESNMQIQDENKTKDNSLLRMIQIVDQIKQFQSQLKKRKESVKSHLQRFLFRDESLYHFVDKLNIKEKVQQLQIIMQKGFNFSYFAQINPAYAISEKEIQLQKEKYCKQFNEFAQQNIRGYIQFLEIDESSLPQSFQYFHYLTFYLVQCKINFIKIHYKMDENAYIVNDNPYFKLNEILKYLSNRYIRKIKALEQDIVSEKKLLFKQELQNKLKDLKKKRQADEAILQEQKKQKRKEIEYQMFTSTQKQIDNQKQKIEQVYSKAQDILTQKYLQKTNELQSQVILKIKCFHQYLETLLKIVKIIQTTLSNELISSLQSRFLEVRQFVYKNKLQSIFQKYFEQKNKYIPHLRKLMQMPKIQHLKSFQRKLNSRSSTQITQRISKKSQDYLSDRDSLAVKVSQFQREFKKIKTNFITKNKQIKDLVKQVNLKNKVQTLATIAAIWSLSKSLTKQKSEYIWQAKLHHVEVLSLLMFTCRQVEDEDQATNNQKSLINVKCGQGKSLIIAVLATYYALNFYNVNVACYSSQVSKQTHKRFSFLFQSFNVIDKIQYESFHEICQKKLFGSFATNLTQTLLAQQKKKGFFNSVKELGKKLFKWPTKQISNNKEVLLLDEVDMLWAPDYRDRSLTPIIKLPLPEFIKIIKHVWNQIKDEKLPEPEQIYILEEYQVLKNRYPNLKDILQSSIKALLTAFQNQPRHSYNLYQKQIHYLDKQKSLVPLNFGYQTMLNYCREYQAKNMSLSNLEKQLYLLINVGHFSYTETAKYFEIIQGVSSGLQVIQQNKKQFLSKHYEIPTSNMYLMPSIYEEAEEETILKYKLCDHSLLFPTITKCILSTQNWPLLVCFKNYKSLRNFQESSQFKSLCRNYNTLHYMKSSAEKQKIISEAGQKDVITLVTADLIWGLNIEIAPDVIDTRGNLHLIVAYIPESQGELQQLKGRTGRMGQYGLINFIFNEDEFKIKLKQLSYKINLPQNSDKVEQCLKEYYNINDLKTMNPKTSRIVSMEEQHRSNIVKHQSKDSKASLQQLIKMNTCASFKPKNYYISIAIQGTQSMRDVFLILIKNISKIFTQINDLRAKMKIKQTASLSIMVYSNYNRLGETIQETSNYYQTPDSIALFLKQKQPELQEDRSSAALELVLRLITLKKKADMLFIIGNSKPNSLQEIENYMKMEGWKNYAQKQFCTNEEQFYIRRTLQSEAALANRNLIINGLSITGEERNPMSNQLLKILKQLSEDFRGEAKQVDISKLVAEFQIIKSIVTNTLYVLNGCKSKEQIQKLYDSYKKEH